MCQSLQVLPILCVREKPSKASEQDELVTKVMSEDLVAGSVTTNLVIKWRNWRDFEKHSGCFYDQPGNLFYQ